jgi:O-antigen ligase
LAAVAVIGIAVVLSASRAGIIALFVVVLFFVFYQFKIKTRFKIIILSFSVVLALSGLYFMKKDSADGRLLIWRCTYEMVKDKPLFGYGQGGFKANYMNYQAKYFEEHPNSRYAMLADNVNRPFNLSSV